MRRFLSAVLAVILVISMPMSAFAATETWTCTNGHENNIENLFCGKCGEAKPEEDESWTCTNGHENLSENTFCTVCGEKRQAYAGNIEEQPGQEPFENKGDYEFTFRNGVKWGMSESEIRGLEGIGDGDVFEGGFANSVETLDGHHFSHIYLSFISVSKHDDATLVYSLYDDSLYSVGYILYGQIDLEDIVRELTGEYAKEVPINSLKKAKLFSYLYPPAGGFENEEEAALKTINTPGFDAVAETMHYWLLPDSTEIFIGVNDLEDYTNSFICYWNQAYRTFTANIKIPSDSQPAPAPAPTPMASPKPVTDSAADNGITGAPIVIKSPDDEKVTANGKCQFVAGYENAKWAEWHFVSPDGSRDLNYTDAQKEFPSLKIFNGYAKDMTLENVPEALNGWKVYCRFSNDYGSIDTDLAAISVIR